MKKILVLIVLCVVFSGVNAFSNQGSNYFGINLSRCDYSYDGMSGDFNPLAVIGKLGYCFHRNFAVEGRLGLGLTEDENDAYGHDVSMELDNLIGIYCKGFFDIDKKIQVYGLIGLTRAEGTVEGPGFSDSDDDNDLSYGIGIDFKIAYKLYIGLEYMNYLSKSDYDLDAIAVGVTKYF